MAKNANLARTISVIIFSMLCVGASVCQVATTYYVDALYSGGSNNGSAAHPWTALSSGWSSINTALASGPVTVYFSASNPAHTANETSTAAISLSRTDTSTNVLTLDGISQYNTNSASPSWTTNVVPAACNHDAVGCNWPTAFKFQINSATESISGPTVVSPMTGCEGYFVIQGFTLRNAEGQSANLEYLHDLTFQYNDVARTATGTYGPEVFAGPGNKGPCYNGSTFSGPDNVTIQYNYISKGWADCIYIGASTPDPPGYQGTDGEYNNVGLTCTNACSTGSNYVIQQNVLESCSSWGGAGHGVNIKDGHANLQITQNIIRTTKSCTNCGTNSCSQTGVPGPGCDSNGITVESGALMAANYVEAPEHQCIAVYSSWNNTAGRGTMNIENNICVNANSGVGSNAGYNWYPPTILQGVTPPAWIGMNFYNNTAYNVGNVNGDPCILIQSGGSGNGTNPANSANVENNVLSTCGGPGLKAAAGIVNVHDYNDYYNTASCVSETHSICADPKFISTAPPYVDTNFRLQAGTPVGSTGTNLSSFFTTDYFGATRTTPWDMSAVTTGPNPPNPPTNLVVTVN